MNKFSRESKFFFTFLSDDNHANDTKIINILKASS